MSEREGDPVNEAVKESWRHPAGPVTWTYEPCAREHRPGWVCILPEGHAAAPAPPVGADDGLGAALRAHALRNDRCTCGETYDVITRTGAECAHCAHVAAVLRAQGWRREQ